MKANRKFKEDGEAVSAVIGVILMVAITVAIAATVYVYVSGMLTESSDKAPDIGFSFSDKNDFPDTDDVGGLTVSSVSAGDVSWSDITLGGTSISEKWESGYIKTGQTINVSAAGTLTVSWQDQKLYGTWTFT